MGEKQETVPEVTEQVEAVRVSLEDLGKMTSETCRLRQQVDALLARGTELMMERQELWRALRIIANRTTESPSDTAADVLKRYPT